VSEAFQVSSFAMQVRGISCCCYRVSLFDGDLVLIMLVFTALVGRGAGIMNGAYQKQGGCLLVLPGSGKIQGNHRDRLAVVYVRQSTLKQVKEHQESGRLQYALRERAVELGWSPRRVLVIDEDQGRSGKYVEGRSGFQRLVAEVGLNHVGLVLGIEISRLARSNSDWYHLLDMCGLYQMLIGDVDGIYDPRNYNDRLLLGLKGTMSEAELHILKQRLDAGKWGKARRGELGMPVPMGYVRRPSGEVVKDPDEQAQAVVELVFAAFARYRTVNRVLRYLLDEQVEFPRRVSSGADKGSLRWSRASRSTLNTMLKHPIYAGAYVYGRRRVDATKQCPGRRGSGRVSLPMEEWAVCLKDRLPAYISWEEYEGNVRQIASNSTVSGIGAPRRGPSLLAGVVLCGRCGLRMTTRYSQNGRGLQYVCDRRHTLYREPVCQTVSGRVIDEALSRLVLQALQPLALELSLNVAHDLEAERARVLEQWEQRLKRVRYEAQRAYRQYNAVEPENRLVTRELERQWEAALQSEAALKLEYERVVARQPVPLTASERAAIQRLTSDIPALWHARTSTAAERQSIVRQLIEQVVITLEGKRERIGVEVHWAGGHRTCLTVIRPVARQEQLSYYAELVRRVAALRNEGQSAAGIAQILSDEGWRPAQGGERFPESTVQRLLMRRAVRQFLNRPPASANIPKGANEWSSDEMVELLDMPRVTLYGWIKKGVVRARRTCYRNQPVWLIWTDETELERLRALRADPRARTAQREAQETLAARPESTSAVTTVQETGRDDNRKRSVDKPAAEEYLE